MRVRVLHFSFLLIIIICLSSFKVDAQRNNKKVLAIGQTYSLGKLNYRIDRVKFKKYIGGLLTLKRAHGEFLIISITVTNKSRKQLIMDDSLFKLEDSSGALYDYSPDATVALALSDFPGVSFIGMTINPNITKTGKAIFEVPSQEKKYYLILLDENEDKQLNILLN